MNRSSVRALFHHGPTKCLLLERVRSLSPMMENCILLQSSVVERQLDKVLEALVQRTMACCSARDFQYFVR